MGKVELKVQNTDIIALKHSEIIVSEFLRIYLSDKSSSAFREVCDQLQDYYKDEGGSPVVATFEIDKSGCSFDQASNKGKAKIRYAVQYHFGCSDLSPSTSIAETCDFLIDENINALAVFIPDKVVRDTIDEF